VDRVDEIRLRDGEFPIGVPHTRPNLCERGIDAMPEFRRNHALPVVARAPGRIERRDDHQESAPGLRDEAGHIPQGFKTSDPEPRIGPIIPIPRHLVIDRAAAEDAHDAVRDLTGRRDEELLDLGVEAHDIAARHGFQGVELTTGVLDAPAEERRQVAADLDARDVRAGGFSLPMRFDRDEAEYAARLADLPAVRRRRGLLHTSDAADDLLCVDLGGRRILKTNRRTQPHHASWRPTYGPTADNTSVAR